ncbi:PAS domain S-box-containing protein [Hymenobacter luteus]|uniref:histidine kinase n=2 Tax=Hymenobacter TaxID=89966 RepID=A0A7W9SZF4_9BACT|nr:MULTISPECIES: PAS domain-containing sensor histidine kinase [Hymenobacter]MBB4599936.1 PAS domain S-box-containing protein [Hymenobacter latericoloratus]MBB6057754.1 PAS domain S-box-containing protein [Hymenobacter luteus]
MLAPPDFVSAPDLLHDALELSHTPLALLRPAYAATGELTDFYLEYLNPASQRATGLPERPPQTLATYFLTVAATGTLPFLQQVFETGEASQHEVSYQHPGLDVRLRLSARRRGNLLIVAFTEPAGTDRSAVEQALRESRGREQLARAEAEAQRQQLQDLFMQAPACIASLEGPQLVFTLVNPQYQQLVGERLLLGLPLRQAWPELEGQPFYDLLESVYQTGKTVYGTEQVAYLDRTNSGRLEPVYFNFIYEAIRSGPEQVTGVTIFAYDVTEQVVARQQVQRLNEELAAANEELQVANEEFLTNNAALQQTQQQLRLLNLELEARVLSRTRQVKAAQAATEIQRATLERLFMQAPAAICILTGPQLVFELVNPAYQQLFPGRALRGRPILEALPEIAGHAVFRTLEQVYQTGRTHEELGILIPLAGHDANTLEERFFDYVQQAYFDEQGLITGVVVFAFEVTTQVRARQTSEASVRQLQLITDSLPILISYIDRAQTYQFANQAYESWFQLSPRQLLGRPVVDIIGERAYQNVQGYIQRALAGERLDFEAQMPYRSGFTRHIRTSYVPDVRDGQVLGFYSMVLDITAQVAAQQEADRQRQLLHTLFMEAPAPIVILDGPAFVFQLVNPAYQRIFPGRALSDKPILEALPELTNTPIIGILKQVYSTGETFVAQELPLQLARHEGGPLEDIYWTFTYQARRNLEGAVDGILVFAHEVTDQVQARRVIEQSEQYVRQLADNVPAMIWVTNPEGSCTYLNQQWFAYTGQTRAEALGRGWLQAVHPEDVATTTDVFLEATASQTAFSLLYRQRRHDGQYRWAIDTGLPRFNAQGEFEGHIGTVFDIHEQKQAEQSLRRLTRQLRATNQQLVRTNVDLDNFIYTASHDLKAPITNIEGLVYALQAQLPPQEAITQQVAPLLTMMQESVERFQRTIHHLSDVTKLQKEYGEPTTLVPLAPVVTDVLLDLQGLVDQVGAQVEVDVAECPSVLFSTKNLRSVLYNLLSNALKYHHPGRVPRIRVQCRQEEGFTVLLVEDNGLGLEASKQAQLFTMFRRFHTHVEGSGIGLYMVKRSVENAGGRITVQSKPDQGSVFSVYFRNAAPEPLVAR